MPYVVTDGFDEFHQPVAVVVVAGDMVTTAEIQPFELAEEGFEFWLNRSPRALQRFEPLFAERVHVQPVYSDQSVFGQLADGCSQARAGRAGIVFGNLAFGMFRIDAQADLHICGLGFGKEAVF